MYIYIGERIEERRGDERRGGEERRIEPMELRR
jgi:hypothetical protein